MGYSPCTDRAAPPQEAEANFAAQAKKGAGAAAGEYRWMAACGPLYHTGPGCKYRQSVRQLA